MDNRLEDFSAFFLKDTTRVEIELPNGEPMLFKGEQVAFNIYGPSTDEFQKAKEALDKEAMKRVMANLGNKKKKGEESEDKDADVKFLAAITESVENFPYPGGALEIYKNSKLKYIADQVRAHLNDLGNFFPAAANS